MSMSMSMSLITSIPAAGQLRRKFRNGKTGAQNRNASHTLRTLNHPAAGKPPFDLQLIPATRTPAARPTRASRRNQSFDGSFDASRLLPLP
jgi:hypothetical protein